MAPLTLFPREFVFNVTLAGIQNQNQNQNQNLKASSITAYSGSLEYYFMLNFVDCAFSTVSITSVLFYEFVYYISYIFMAKKLSISVLKVFRLLIWTTLCGSEFQSFITL